MEAKLEKIDLNNLDKSQWEIFRFEDIVKRISESVDPNTTTLEKYVGLEHIDPENIHIKRFGTPDDVSGGKLKCYPGDVIFGKRRAYQRKAAIVDFEGICSAHAFVFRANPKVIDPKLFPFFLHSDQFMHRAVDISVGGLSPTINWGDLKGQEFLLPPKGEQARLAELLWSMDEVIEKEKWLLDKLKIVSNIKTLELINGKNNEGNSSWGTFKLSDVAKIKSGGTPKRNNKLYWNGDIHFVKISDMTSTERFIENTEEKITMLGLMESSANLFPKETVLFAMYASIGEVVILKSKMTTSQAILGCICNSKIRPYFLWAWFKINKERLILMGRGATQSNLNAEIVKNLNIKLPDINTQDKILYKIENYLNSIESCSKKILSSQSLQKSLINQIF